MKKRIGFCGMVWWAWMAWGQGEPVVFDWGVLDTSGREPQKEWQQVRTDSRAALTQSPTSRDTAPWLVQFVAGTREDGVAAIEAVGGVAKGGGPRNAVLVEATPEQMAAIGAREEIVWAGEHRPDYKISRGVREWSQAGSDEVIECEVVLLRAADRVRIGQRIAELKGAYVTATESGPDGAMIQARLPNGAVEAVAGWGEVVRVALHGGGTLPEPGVDVDGYGPGAVNQEAE